MLVRSVEIFYNIQQVGRYIMMYLYSVYIFMLYHDRIYYRFEKKNAKKTACAVILRTLAG